MNEKANEYSWFPLIVVACASFIIVLDSFFMNVSISRIVVDLNADVSTIQMIVSFCTLITAALILFSTKLQDIVGKKKLFVIGAALFGIGIFAAVLSSSVTMFFVGWAAIKGVAAALMLPAIVIFRQKAYNCFGNSRGNGRTCRYFSSAPWWAYYNFFQLEIHFRI